MLYWNPLLPLKFIFFPSCWITYPNHPFRKGVWWTSWNVFALVWIILAGSRKLSSKLFLISCLKNVIIFSLFPLWKLSEFSPYLLGLYFQLKIFIPYMCVHACACMCVWIMLRTYCFFSVWSFISLLSSENSRTLFFHVLPVFRSAFLLSMSGMSIRWMLKLSASILH